MTGGPTTEPGWISVRSDIPLRIVEGGRVVGTTDSERIMLAGGRHNLELVNEPLEVRLARPVFVQGGRSQVIEVARPVGLLNINARPWAEVFAQEYEARRDASRQRVPAGWRARTRLPASAVRGAPPDGDGPGRDAGPRVGDLHTMSRTTRCLLLVMLMLQGLARAFGQPAEDSLAAARQLDASASYDDALTMLDRLEQSAATPDREIPLTWRCACSV